MVQIETLGEFGVFFILFAVGLEFSPDSIRKVSTLLKMYAKLKCFLIQNATRWLLLVG